MVSAAFSDFEMGIGDTMTLGKLGTQAERDRRMKKKYGLLYFLHYLYAYKGRPRYFFMPHSFFVNTDTSFWKTPGKEAWHLPSGTVRLSSPG